MIIQYFRTALLLILLASSGAAFSDRDQDKARELQESGQILPLDKLLTRVLEKHPGQILEVEFEKEKGIYIYEIEILTREGIVLELKYDAHSGQLLKIEKER